MTAAAILLLILAAGLWSRLGRLRLALVLLRLANALHAVGGRLVDSVDREAGR